jgi:hypothetical protein
MKKPKEYKMRMTVQPNGEVVLNYVIERVQLNQHKARWLPSDKRKFTKSLNNKTVTCK